MNLKTIGVIRGDELATNWKTNPTLSYAHGCGMKLHFVSRAYYKEKASPDFIAHLHAQFGDFYNLPEGGTNALAVKGCEEILSAHTAPFDIICAAVGTGGTLSGLINASEAHQTIFGYSALKGTFQHSEIKKYTQKSNYHLTDSYCFGGYGKIDATLVRFINDFKHNNQIPLDPIYIGKMMYGIWEDMKNKKFKENSRILAIHTGGLQGIAGMNQILQKKQLPQIL